MKRGHFAIVTYANRDPNIRFKAPSGLLVLFLCKELMHTGIIVEVICGTFFVVSNYDVSKLYWVNPNSICKNIRQGYLSRKDWTRTLRNYECEWKALAKPRRHSCKARPWCQRQGYQKKELWSRNILRVYIIHVYQSKVMHLELCVCVCVVCKCEIATCFPAEGKVKIWARKSKRMNFGQS